MNKFVEVGGMREIERCAGVIIHIIESWDNGRIVTADQRKYYKSPFFYPFSKPDILLYVNISRNWKKDIKKPVGAFIKNLSQLNCLFEDKKKIFAILKIQLVPKDGSSVATSTASATIPIGGGGTTWLLIVKPEYADAVGLGGLVEIASGIGNAFAVHVEITPLIL